jgi:4-coumarate--CoA ligase
MGYKNNREATAETYDAEGYLHTGDIGSMIPGGLLLIQDRLKEMIKVNCPIFSSERLVLTMLQVKGVGIAPAELEDLLLGHPLVVDAAVIGIPDSYSGELPKAFVVLDSNAKPNHDTSNILQEFVRKKKSRSKWLGGGVEFVDQIPKSASGKILRRVLRDSEKAKTQKNTMKPRL